MSCHRAKHTSCCRNTDPFQLFTDRFLQFLFHHTDGVSYLLDIMYLSVQHSTGIVLLHPLCYNNEPVLIPVAYRSHNTSGSNIQTKHMYLRFFFLRSQILPNLPVDLFKTVLKLPTVINHKMACLPVFFL